MKRIFEAYKVGWKTLIKHWKLWATLYTINLLFAVILAIPFNGLIRKTVGDSMALADSKYHFDFGFIGDFINNYGIGLSPILDQSLLFIAIYFILQSFFSGGILDYLGADISTKKNSFGQACLKWFFPMFRISIYFILIQAVIIILFYFFFAALLGGISPFDIENEGNMIVIFRIVFPFYVVFFSFLLCVRDYTKIRHMESKRLWLAKSILGSMKWSGKHILYIMGLFITHALTFLFVYYIYQWVKYMCTGDNSISLFLLFLVVQLFVIFRTGLRMVHLISASKLYHGFKN